MAAGDVQRAIEEANIAIEIDATTGDAFAARGLARLAREYYEDAISDLEHNVEVQSRSPASLASLATGYAMAGQTERAVALLAEIEQIAKSRFVPPDEFARVHVALGNIDTAFELLQDALEARSRGMIFLHTNLSWDPIREDPRFHDLLQAMQLSANDAD
jgi:tetratricopeptide (TPR) repeat protein